MPAVGFDGDDTEHGGDQDGRYPHASDASDDTLGAIIR